MYDIKFNSVSFAKTDVEENAIGLALSLHKNSNVSHNIVVTKEDVNILNLFNDVSNESV